MLLIVAQVTDIFAAVSLFLRILDGVFRGGGLGSSAPVLYAGVVGFLTPSNGARCTSILDW